MANTAGNEFSYDFGINIASSTVSALRSTAAHALTLTAAIYGLSRITSEYVDSLKRNQLAFGGQLKTIKAMHWAQQQLIDGVTSFDTEDIMTGMRELMSAGINAQKNFKFLSDAASATGQSFTEFSSAVSSAISGNMSGLVQMGLLTERATKHFDRFAANTTMRQQAILNFIQSHKGLQKAIENSFSTISGQWKRLVANMRMFAEAIMGNPTDPNSFYRGIVDSLKSIADFFKKHGESIRKAGAAIGMVMNWVVRQIGKVVVWLGDKIVNILKGFKAYMSTFFESMHSLILWLELWKVHALKVLRDFYHKHEKLIDGFGKFFLKALALSLILKAIGGVIAILATLVSYIVSSVMPVIHLFRAGIAGVIWALNAMYKTGAAVIRFFAGGGLAKTLTLFRGIAASAWSFTAALLANPITWIVVAVAALAYGVYKLVKHWDDVQKYAKSLGDNILFIIQLVNPLAGMILMMAKYWNEIKTSAYNVYAFLHNLWIIIKHVNKLIWERMKKGFDKVKEIVSSFVDKLSKLVEPFKIAWQFLKDKFEPIIKRISDFFTPIIDFFKSGGTWLGNAWNKIVGFTKGLADKTATAANTIAPGQGIQGLTTEEYKQKFNKPEAPASSTTPTSGSPLLQPMNNTYNDSQGNIGTVSVSKGAVQINIMKGTDMDENKLAEAIRRILPQLAREEAMRSGQRKN